MAETVSMFQLVSWFPIVLSSCVGVSNAALLPGISIHQCGCSLPLGGSSLQDLINLVFVVYRDLLQALDNDAPL